MGGAKKPRISQLEKRLMKEKKEGEGEKQIKEKIAGDISMPPMEELLEFARSQKYLTPSVIAEKFGIKLSIARQALSRLLEARAIRLVSGNSKLRIYAPVEMVAAAVAEKPEGEAVEKPAATGKKKKAK